MVIKIYAPLNTVTHQVRRRQVMLAKMIQGEMLTPLEQQIRLSDYMGLIVISASTSLLLFPLSLVALPLGIASFLALPK